MFDIKKNFDILYINIKKIIKFFINEQNLN